MEEQRDTTGKAAIQIALVIGIIILMYNNLQGWGWLILLLLLT